MQNGSAGCEAVSVWQNDSYRILGRCDGLVYPYTERLDRYVLWITPPEDPTPVYLSEIREGIIDSYAFRPFSEVFITAEERINPETPGRRIMSARVEPFSFSRDDPALPTPTGEAKGAADEFSLFPTPTPTPGATGGILGRLVKSPFAVFGSVATVLLVLLVLGVVLFVRR